MSLRTNHDNSKSGDTLNSIDFNRLMQMYADKLDTENSKTPDVEEILDEPDLFSDNDENSNSDDEESESEHEISVENNSEHDLEELMDTIDDVDSDDESEQDSNYDSKESHDPQVDYLAKLEKTIQELSKLLDVTKKKKTLFDDEDRTWIAEEIDTLAKEYQRKKSLYLKNVLPLEKIIEERQNILSAVKCLNSRPALLDKFIHKQVAITRLLQNHKSQFENQE